MTRPKCALTPDIVLVIDASTQLLLSFRNTHLLLAAVSNSKRSLYPTSLLRAIMAANEELCAKNGAMASDVESEAPTSQSSMSAVDAHHAAAAAKVERKAAEKKENGCQAKSRSSFTNA